MFTIQTSHEGGANDHGGSESGGGGSLLQQLDELEGRVANISASLDRTSNQNTDKKQWTCTKLTVVFMITILVLLMCSYASWRWMMSFQEDMSNTFKPL